MWYMMRTTLKYKVYRVIVYFVYCNTSVFHRYRNVPDSGAWYFPPYRLSVNQFGSYVNPLIRIQLLNILIISPIPKLLFSCVWVFAFARSKLFSPCIKVVWLRLPTPKKLSIFCVIFENHKICLIKIQYYFLKLHFSKTFVGRHLIDIFAQIIYLENL